MQVRAHPATFQAAAKMLNLGIRGIISITFAVGANYELVARIGAGA